MASIRIIAGKHGGRKIEAPRNDNKRTHPMGERIRNAVFNSLGTLIDDAAVLDAFAGTGAVGLEAISRGASSVLFIEKDRIAQNIIENNIKILGEAGRAKIIKTSVINWAGTNDDMAYDLIFVDPPYFNTQVGAVRELAKRLSRNGTMIVSWPETETAPEIENMTVIDSRVYAGAKIYFFKRDLSTG